MTTPHLAAISAEILRHHGGQGLVGEADVVEFAVDVDGGEVLLDVEGVGHVGGVEDEVEGEGVGFGPFLGVVGDEFFGAEFEGVGFFVRGVGYYGDFGAEGGGPEDGEVA